MHTSFRGHTIETIRIDPHLDINHGKGLLSAAVVSRHSVHGLGDVVQNQIQIHLILLWAENKKGNTLSHIVKSVRLNGTYIYNFGESIYKVSSVWKGIMTPSQSLHYKCPIRPFPPYIRMIEQPAYEL